MGLFKSQADKERELRDSVRRSVREMDKAIAELDDSRKRYMGLAKEALRHKIKEQLSLALAGMKTAIAQQTRIRSYKLNVEIMYQNWQTLRTTKGFLQTMRGISRDMVKLADDKEYAVAVKEFDAAIAANEKQEDRLNDFLARSEEAFRSESARLSEVKDEDIVRLLDAGSAIEEGGESEESLDSLMKRIEGEMAKDALASTGGQEGK